MKKMIVILIFGLFFLQGCNSKPAGTNDTAVINGPVTINKNNSVDVKVVATDIDGDTLSYRISIAPSHGTATMAGDVLTYTPNRNFVGTDIIGVVANNGSVDSNVIYIRVTVEGVNDAPVANNATATTPEDTAVDVQVIATDADGDTLSYSISTTASHGTATIVGNTLTYTPNLNFEGTDIIGVIANDGTLDSNEANITITVTAVNDAPVANNATVTTAEDTAVDVQVIATDADGDTLSYSISTTASHGTATIVGNTLTYTPNLNFEGTDSIGVVANDGSLDSNEANITITVTAVNDAPVANDKVYITEVNDGCSASAVDLDVTDNDVDSDGSIDVHSIEIITNPSHGAIGITATGKVSYESSVSYEGNDTFSYKVKDNQGKLSNEATVFITVEHTNTAPIAFNDKMRVLNDASTLLDILLNDTDDAGLDVSSIVIINDVSQGSTSIMGDGKVEYTPDSNYLGDDSFTYTVKDSEGLVSNEVTVTVTVVDNSVKPITPETKATNWYLRIDAEDTTNNMKTDAAQLGQLEVIDAVSKHSLKAIAPFRPTYLDVVFKDPAGIDAGEYKSNFHTTSTSDSWEFTVKSNDSNAEIILSWRGLYVLTPYTDTEGRERYQEYRSNTNPLISFMKLVDVSSGAEIVVDNNGTAQVYTFNMSGSISKTFRWVLEDAPVVSPPVPKQVKMLKTLKVKALRKDATARPDALKKKRLESFDMMIPPTFEVLVK